MKAFIISAIIVCSLITGCKDTPEVQGTAVPDPLFIGAERNSRAIEIEIVDEFKDEAWIMYIMNGPAIMGFREASVSGSSIDSQIAGERIELSVDNNVDTIHYEGESDSFYVDIVIDKVDNTFTYKQISFIEAMYNGSPQKFISISEGAELHISDDGGIEGDFRTLVISTHADGVNASVLTGEIFSDSTVSAIALLLSYPYQSKEFIGLPSMEEAKDISVMEAVLDKNQVGNSMRLYWQEDNIYKSDDYYWHPEHDSSADDETVFKYIHDRASVLFDGRWDIKSPFDLA